jgi:predicted nucleic acid-binding protein
MPKFISNTSCLIILANINCLDILQKLYSRIYITPEVALEFGEDLPSWIEIVEVKNSNYTKILNQTIDLGEASTIALHLEIENSVMILDDKKARNLAQKMDLKLTGTLGVIIKAHQTKIIDNMEFIIDQFKQKGFRIPTNILSELQKQ